MRNLGFSLPLSFWIYSSLSVLFLLSFSYVNRHVLLLFPFNKSQSVTFHTNLGDIKCEIACDEVPKAAEDILVGLLRLRKCGRNVTCPEVMGKCSIVRELHVYGTAVPVHGRDADKLQHQGYGTLLMEEAERIAQREHRSTKVAIISGVGTRHYYKNLGYELEGPYMAKSLV